MDFMFQHLPDIVVFFTLFLLTTRWVRNREQEQNPHLNMPLMGLVILVSFPVETIGGLGRAILRGLGMCVRCLQRLLTPAKRGVEQCIKPCCPGHLNVTGWSPADGAEASLGYYVWLGCSEPGCDLCIKRFREHSAVTQHALQHDHCGVAMVRTESALRGGVMCAIWRCPKCGEEEVFPASPNADRVRESVAKALDIARMAGSVGG